MKRIQLVLITFTLALVGSAAVHAAEFKLKAPASRSLLAPGVANNGCSIQHSTDRAYQRANPAQRKIMDKARATLDSLGRQAVRDRQTGTLATAAPMEVTIPVVVHVVHDNGVENISDARIIAAINQMTEDYHAYPYAGTVDGYGYLQSNVGFTFKLAKLDPQGRPTTGITRTRSTVTYNGSEGPLQATINWPRQKYLNIWVVYSSDGSNGSAYSNYPSTVADGTGIEYWDGIVVSYWAVGPSAASGYEKILTHEAGHWANLIHTWGDTYNNGDSRACSDPVGDRVSDTPLTFGNSGCRSSSTCGYSDNTENFMDYGSCTTMFTIGQGDRQQTAMRSAVSGRSNTWSQANLIATGLAQGPANQPPTANFSYSGTGLAVNFVDGSTDPDGSIASRSWNFGDGTSSTAANPSKTYAAAGTYSVVLTVTDNQGATASRTQSVTVTGGTTPPPTSTLSNGVAKTSLSAATGASLNFTMDVPAGATNLKFVMSGGTGDADMYVKFGSAPTSTVYDCRPYASGNAETCAMPTAQAGRYYVMLNAYAAFSGVSLTGSYTGGGTTNTPPVAGFSFTSSGLTATFTDSSTDANGSIASRAWNFGDGTSSTATNPSKTYAAAGTYTVQLTVTDNQGATNAISKSVTVTAGGGGLPECTGDPTSLGKNCARSNLSATTGNYVYMYVYIPQGTAQLRINSSGGTGDADLYVSTLGSWATNTSYNYSSTNGNNTESVTVNNPPAGYVYISLYADSSFSGVKVTTQY